MNRPTWRHVARVTIELTSPLSLRTGRTEDVLDTLLVTDANGLPAVPGTSLAGTLRSAWQNRFEEESAKELFGRTDLKVEVEGEVTTVGVRSRVHVSWASVHDSHDRPVSARLPDGSVAEDPVLSSASFPIVRDRVRLDHRGAVDGDGKFDICAVATGHRFTFELLVEGDEAARVDLDRLLALLASGQVRLGAATRSGFGAFAVVRVARGSFDLSVIEQLDAFVALDPDLASAAPSLTSDERTQTDDTTGATRTLQLKSTEPLLIGGGDPREAPGRTSLPDMSPLLEHRIEWADGRGRVSTTPDVVIPGTAIKGALRHRTAFHLRRFRGLWAHLPEVQQRPDDAGSKKHPVDPWAPDRLEGLDILFGTALPDSNGDERGVPGCVHLSEVRVPLDDRVKRRLADHVALDRFTGGVIMGALFLEDALVLESPIRITVRVDEPFTGVLPADVRSAFDEALTDLANGRLNLGAGFGRGRGWFSGGASPWTGPTANQWEAGA